MAPFCPIAVSSSPRRLLNPYKQSILVCLWLKLLLSLLLSKIEYFKVVLVFPAEYSAFQDRANYMPSSTIIDGFLDEWSEIYGCLPFVKRLFKNEIFRSFVTV